MNTMTKQRSIAQIKAHIAACEARYSGYRAEALVAIKTGNLLGFEAAEEGAANALIDLSDARAVLARRVNETGTGRVWMP